jgi:hypothetical protein
MVPFRDCSIMKQLVPLIAALFVTLLCVGDLSAEEFTFQYQKIVEAVKPIDLDLTMATGKVFVNGSAGDQLIVEAVKRVTAIDREEAEEVADHIEIRVDQDGSEISVKTNYLKLGARRKSFWNKLFGGGEDSYGDVDYYITLPATKSLSITAMSADIEIANVEAAIEVENASGSTHAEFLLGPITVRQPTGPIELQWVEGDVRVHSNSGRISVTQMRGSLDLVSRTGDVFVKTELDSPRDFFVETETGHIEVVIPEMASGTVHIETEAGEISTEVPISIVSTARHSLVGEFGTGGPRITLTSLSGDVTMAQY